MKAKFLALVVVAIATIGGSVLATSDPFVSEIRTPNSCTFTLVYPNVAAVCDEGRGYYRIEVQCSTPTFETISRYGEWVSVSNVTLNGFSYAGCEPPDRWFRWRIHARSLWRYP